MKAANDMQYAILGLGVFGSTIAKSLSMQGCEVIAIDKNMDRVDHLSDIVTIAIKGDFTNIDVLRNAGISECDVVIITVSTSLEDSIMAILNSLELGVPRIISRAMNKRYQEILMKIGSHEVICVEKVMGKQIASTLLTK